MKALSDTAAYLKSKALITYAKQLADATDRAFVSLAEGVGRLGPWQQRRSSSPPRLAALKGDRDYRRHSPLCGPTANGCSCTEQRATGATCASVRPRPAGVVPVLEALAGVIESHADRGYASLAEDERFWALIRLLQALADGDSELELAPATGADGSGVEIHVEEDLSHLRSQDTPHQMQDHETDHRERVG